jgi:hypothetical protein
MAHQDTPEAGGDGNPADAQPADPFEAIAAEMLGEDQEEEQPEAEAEDAEEAELDEADEAGEEDDEAEELPPIDPPNSLTAEEKEAFKGWPRAAQETLTRRIGELEKGFQTKAQEAAQAREAARTEALQFAAQLKAEAVEHLAQYARQFEVRPPDARLFNQNPEAYAQQLEAYQYATTQREQAQRDAEQARAEQAQYQAALQEHEAAQFRQRLQAELPEAFETSGQINRGFIETLAATAEALGYDAHSIDNASVEELKALKAVSEIRAKAEKYDALMKRKMERVRAGKSPPPIAKPGVARGTDANRAAKAEQAFARAKSSLGNERVEAFGEYLSNAGIL